VEQMPLKQFSFCSIDIRDHSVSLTLAGYQVANIIFASDALSDPSLFFTIFLLIFPNEQPLQYLKQILLVFVDNPVRRRGYTPK
jgi:hypothetical protein